MDSSSQDSPLKFPCDIPVKVFGRNGARFRRTAVEIVERHFGELGEGEVSEQLSRRERYASLTIVVHAESREQIDALYRELTSNDDILMAL